MVIYRLFCSLRQSEQVQENVPEVCVSAKSAAETVVEPESDQIVQEEARDGVCFLEYTKVTSPCLLDR